MLARQLLAVVWSVMYSPLSVLGSFRVLSVLHPTMSQFAMLLRRRRPYSLSLLTSYAHHSRHCRIPHFVRLSRITSQSDRYAVLCIRDLIPLTGMLMASTLISFTVTRSHMQCQCHLSLCSLARCPPFGSSSLERTTAIETLLVILTHLLRSSACRLC